jgi:hypothetical protein
MAQMLHILNGDATRYEFEPAGIPGDVLVWREMLVEGPAVYPIFSEKWIEKRKQYLVEFYECPPEVYDQRTERKLAQLSRVPHYAEIVLWFEFDLFCQVNMIGVLSALQQLKAQKVSLVCPGEHPDIPDFRGLGQLKREHFLPLFAERLDLSANDLDFADRLYQAYANEDPRVLQQFLHRDFPAAFPHLRAALLLHLKRFPSRENGLSLEEKELLECLKSDLSSRHRWVGQILRQDAQRGFGDLQYFHLIKRLEPLFAQTEERVKLNETGKAVLAGRQDFLRINGEEVWLGGARNKDWRWVDEQQEVVAV